MQDQVMGRTSVLKQINLSMIRKVILEKDTATRAEIVAATNIGVSTVRTLPTELQNAGELAPAGLDNSTGGRSAIRYGLNKERYLGVSLCLDGERVRYLIVNICGDVLPLITECFNGTLPSKMSPEILYADDKWHDYFEGMAYLTVILSILLYTFSSRNL